MCEPASTIGTRLRSLIRRDELALQEFASRMRAILETPLPMDPDTRELQPRILPLSHTARAFLVGFSDTIEAAQKLAATSIDWPK